MRQIAADKWDEELWGLASEPPKEGKPSLAFLFGSDDHWVADRTRDDLIKTRSFEGGADMRIDTNDIPHSFCISQSTWHRLVRRQADL